MSDADVAQAAVNGAQAVADSWPLVEIVLSTGAIGTSAFGIVDALKWTRLGLAGFRRITERLGPPLMAAIERAYGRGSGEILHGYYRQDRATGTLGKALRQGVRVGVRSDEAVELAQAVGLAVDPGKLEQALSKLEQGTPLSDADRSVIGRFELAVDARIDAALAASEASYTGSMRVAASTVALVLACAGTIAVTGSFDLPLALVIGLAAVPVAPIAKDAAAGLNAARRAASAAVGKT